MAKSKIAIADATAAQLRKFAELSLGLPVQASWNKQTTLAAMAAAWNYDFIEFEEEAAPVAPEAIVLGVDVPANENIEIPVTGLSPAELAKRDARLIELLIPLQEDAGGKDMVPLSVNGRALLVPRGVTVKIRRPYFEVLARAVRVTYDQDREGNMIPRHVPQYPYTLISGMGEAEHKALRPLAA